MKQIATVSSTGLDLIKLCMGSEDVYNLIIMQVKTYCDWISLRSLLAFSGSCSVSDSSSKMLCHRTDCLNESCWLTMPCQEWLLRDQIMLGQACHHGHPWPTIIVMGPDGSKVKMWHRYTCDSGSENNNQLRAADCAARQLFGDSLGSQVSSLRGFREGPLVWFIVALIFLVRPWGLLIFGTVFGSCYHSLLILDSKVLTL